MSNHYHIIASATEENLHRAMSRLRRDSGQAKLQRRAKAGGLNLDLSLSWRLSVLERSRPWRESGREEHGSSATTPKAASRKERKAAKKG